VERGKKMRKKGGRVKKVLGVLLVGLIFPLLCSGRELKVGYVDVVEVITNYDKAKDYDRLLNEKREKVEEDLSSQRETIKEMQKGLSLLKDEEQEKQKEKIKQAVEEYKRKEREAVLELRRERNEKMREVFDDIQTIIEDYAKKEGIDLIFNKNVILYSGERVRDLTDEIVEIANQKERR